MPDEYRSLLHRVKQMMARWQRYRVRVRKVYARQAEQLSEARALLRHMKSPAESCAAERAEGNGGCGACAICCAELRAELELERFHGGKQR